MNIRVLIIGIASYFVASNFTNLTMYENLSVSFFVFILVSFIDNLGKKLVVLDIPILIAIITCLLLPIAGYHYFNQSNLLARSWFYFMRVPSEEYYSFMFPATVAMAIGLKLPIFFRTQTYQHHEQYLINAKTYLSNTKWQGLILVAIGLISSVLQNFAPGALAHIFFLMKYLMFVGVFYCLYSNFPNKRIILFLVFGLMVGRSISSGMFGELVFMGTMSIILIVLGIKMHFLSKATIIILGLFSLLILQAVKPAFRKETWSGKNDGNKLSILTDMMSQKIMDPSLLLENETALFGLYGRFNQGMIVSRVLKAVPSRFPYANGETIFLSVASSVVPRILWPTKPESGGKANFERFLGVRLKKVSYGLSPFGEAYGNFGKTGGIIFMLFFGLLFNFFSFLLLKLAVRWPSLILWFPYLFFYATSIETDVVTMLNSFTKAAIFTFIMYKFFPKVFKLKL
ncbi:MAG: hypothetical protein WKF97_11070 [Chitinophagaceae bacterium]